MELSSKESSDSRLERERQHGLEILRTNASNWGWHTPAGRIRWQRRLDHLKSLSLPASAKVLEIGAGTGTFTVGLSQSYEDLTALDISPDLLEVAKAKAPRARLVCMDAHALLFESSTFDAVIGCSVLHHLNWAAALKEFYRVLKPGGLIGFSEPNLLNPQIYLQKNIPFLKRLAGDSPDEYAFSARRIRADLERAGFAQVRADPYEFLHPAVPERFIAAVTRLEALLMKTPVRHIAGSLLIQASKPIALAESQDRPR